MLSAIRSEFRKLLTIRSTYFIFAICLALMALFEFYGLGIRADSHALMLPTYMINNVFSAIQMLSLLGALVSVMMITHEYRYNTIIYTLTASSNRLKVLLAKLFVATIYAIVFTALIGCFAYLFCWIGLQVGNHDLVAQQMQYKELIWRGLAFGWGMVMAGLLFGVLIRSQVGAIAALFLVPGVIEQLLQLVLHKNIAYLPFTALGTVISGSGTGILSWMSTVQAFLIFLCYLVGGWIIAVVLFLKRDAN